jgi:hypothetical protein
MMRQRQSEQRRGSVEQGAWSTEQFSRYWRVRIDCIKTPLETRTARPAALYCRLTLIQGTYRSVALTCSKRIRHMPFLASFQLWILYPVYQLWFKCQKWALGDVCIYVMGARMQGFMSRVSLCTRLTSLAVAAIDRWGIRTRQCRTLPCERRRAGPRDRGPPAERAHRSPRSLRR